MSAQGTGTQLAQEGTLDFASVLMRGVVLASDANLASLGIFNVKAKPYNAVGDGITSDTAAIIAAQNAAIAAGGGTLYFPAGTYKASFTPASGLAYRGEGFRSVLVPDGAPILTQAGGAASGLSQMRFSGLIFDSQNSAVPAIKMLAWAYANITFEHCVFRDFVSAGEAMVALGAGNVPTLPLTRNAFTSLRMQFSRCLFSSLNCSTREALLAIAWGDSLIESCVFANCTVSGAGVLDLYAYNDHVTVADCIFSGNNGTAGGNATDVLMTNGTHLAAVNNQHRGGGQYWHGYSVQNCRDVRIEPATCENILNGAAPYASTFGIWFFDSTGTFDGNAVLYATTSNVKVAGTFTNMDWGVNLPAAGSATGMSDIVIAARFVGIGSIPIKLGGIANAASYANIDIIGARIEDGSWSGPAIDIQNGVSGAIRDTFMGNSASSAYGIFIDKGTGTVAPAIDLSGNTLVFTGTGAHPAVFQDVSGNIVRAVANHGYNPVGKYATQPTLPASGVAYTNTLGTDATAFITGGTVTVVSIGGQSTGIISGAFRVPAGQTIAVTYSVAPTWLWFGD